MTDKRRLIEVAFPLKQASVASVHEKNVRHGHISTLHVWPARRPLAASRAALLATLLPDPEDPIKRQKLLSEIGGQIVKRHVKDTDLDGNIVLEDKEVVEGGVLAWGQENAPELDQFCQTIREFYGDAAPRVLDPFAGGGAIPFEAMRLGCDVTASDLNPVAWLILKCTLDYPQRFAGTVWPLPDFVRDWSDYVEDLLTCKIRQQRGRRRAHFSDARQLALMKLPDADISWHVKAWGHWVLERSRADLASHFPLQDGNPTVAYLWARTARDKETGGRIPLLKTFWLCRKKGRRAAILPAPKADRSEVTFTLLQESQLCDLDRVIAEHPSLKEWEITPETLGNFLNGGTMNRSGVWSPLSGRPGMIALTPPDIRRQGQQGLMGIQMIAVAFETKEQNSKRTTKRYRSPSDHDLEASHVEVEELEEAFAEIPFGIPDEPIPTGSSRRSGGSAFTVPLYGFNKWRDLFTNRQLLVLAVFVRHTREAIRQLQQQRPEIAEAVGAYLLIAIDRLADYNSQQCNWDCNREYITHTFHRFALPMKWDFCEIDPFSERTGNYLGGIDWIQRFIWHALKASENVPAPNVQADSAIRHQTLNTDVVLTDPPYYDEIPYSDLMDFFYVWLRRGQHGVLSFPQQLFNKPLSPKWDLVQQDGELIDDGSRFSGDRSASKQAYEDGMAKAFCQCCANLREHGRLVVVFANKDVDAWERLLNALIRSGVVVTGSWPIQTEMPNRTRGVSSAALSTSVWIVCRKRASTAPVGWEEQVLDKMQQILFDIREVLGGRNILQYYFDLGIRGPDLIWAALGPALEAFSAHSFVKKTAGGMLTVKEFLAHVRKLVLQFRLGELPGFKELHQTTRGRGESVELDAITQYYLLHRAYFGLEPAPAGACILYANACGKNETELKIVWNILEQGGKTKRGRPRNDELEESMGDSESPEETKGNEYRLLSWEERASRDGLGEARAGQPAPLIDRLQRLMYLFQQNYASDVQQLFETWGLSNERAFKPLLQAVRELALRDKKDSERRVVEALATQLRMNRKMVMVANEMKEVDLFEAADKRTAAAVQD